MLEETPSQQTKEVTLSRQSKLHPQAPHHLQEAARRALIEAIKKWAWQGEVWRVAVKLRDRQRIWTGMSEQDLEALLEEFTLEELSQVREEDPPDLRPQVTHYQGGLVMEAGRLYAECETQEEKDALSKRMRISLSRLHDMAVRWRILKDHRD